MTESAQAAGTVAANNDYTRCFGCGEANPIGLKLRFRWEEGRALAEFIPGEYHQGWPRITHGGVVSAALDEATGYVTYFMGLHTVTGRMNLRFRHVARLGEKLLLTGYVIKQTKRLVEVHADARKEDGTVVAECTATMFVLTDQEMREAGIE